MNELEKMVIDLKREIVALKCKISMQDYKICRLTEDNEALKEKLKEKEHDFRTLGQYYECSLQYQDELADIVEEKEDTVDELIDRLAKAGQQLSAAENKILGYETEVSLLQQKLARAEGKLDKVDNYLRMVQDRNFNI